MEEHLLDEERARTGFRASAAGIYRPRLQQLGFDPKQGESDDYRILRGNLVAFFAGGFKDPAVRAELNKRGRAVLGLDGEGTLDADAVPKDIRGTALWVAVQEGGQPAFDAAEKHLRASRDPVLRGQLLGALGNATDPQLAERARALVFEPDLLRRNEIVALVREQTNEPAMRPALRRWVDTHFSDLEAKLAPAGAALVGLYAEGMCSAEEAAMVESKFAQRMKTIEGGPLELKQTAEGVRLCAAAKQAHAGQPPTFASK
jgi:alanyl aminopeptidase